MNTTRTDTGDTSVHCVGCLVRRVVAFSLLFDSAEEQPLF